MLIYSLYATFLLPGHNNPCPSSLMSWSHSSPSSQRSHFSLPAFIHILRFTLWSFNRTYVFHSKRKILEICFLYLENNASMRIEVIVDVEFLSPCLLFLSPLRIDSILFNINIGDVSCSKTQTANSSLLWPFHVDGVDPWIHGYA